MISTVTKLSSSPTPSTQTLVEEHDHWDRTGLCPFNAQETTKHDAHAWCPNQQTDIRSPCPALNALANHGFLNRSGKNIYIWDIAKALYQGYALSMPFAIFLCVGTLFLIGHWNPFSPLNLAAIGRHNRVEHNASLVHNDVDERDGLRYGTSKVNQVLVKRFKEEVEQNGREENPVCVDSWDVARARVRREKECGIIDAMHQEIARGEMAIALRMWDRETLRMNGNAQGIPLDWLVDWLSEERMPADWLGRLRVNAVKRTGMFEVVKQAKEIRQHVEFIRSMKSANPLN